jgi:hypothetical protein
MGRGMGTKGGGVGFPEALFDNRGQGAFFPASLGLSPCGQVFIDRDCKRNIYQARIYSDCGSGQSVSMVPKPIEFIVALPSWLVPTTPVWHEFNGENPKSLIRFWNSLPSWTASAISGFHFPQIV